MSSLSALNKGESLALSLCSENVHELRDQVENLTQKNAILLEEIETAYKVTDKVKELYEKNAELNDKLRTANGKIEEMEHILQLSNDTNQEFNEKINAERERSDLLLNNERKMRENSVRMLQEDYESKFKCMSEQMCEVKKENEEYLCQMKQTQAQVDTFLPIASAYFNEEFGSLSCLTDYLKKISREAPCANVQLSNVLQNNQSKVNKLHTEKGTNAQEQYIEDDKLKKKLKKTQAKLKEQIKEYCSLKDSLASMIEENKLLRARLVKSDSECSAKIQKVSSEISIIEKKNDLLSAENTKLKQEVERLKQKLGKTTQQANVTAANIEEKNFYEPTLPSTNAELELMKKIEEINGDLNFAVSKRNELLGKISELEMEKADLEVNNKNLLAEHNNMISLIDMQKKQIESLRQSVEAKNKLDNKDNKNNEISELQQTVSKFNKLIDSLKKEKTSYLEEINLKNHELNTNRIELSNLQYRVDEAEKQCKEVKYEYFDYKRSMEKKINQMQNDSLASSVWKSHNFDECLSKKIDEIANNNALQNNSKLIHVYRIIGTHFCDKICKLKKEVDRQNGCIEYIDKKFKKFITDVQICIGTDINANYEDESVMESLIQYIHQVVKDNHIFKATIEQFENITNDMKELGMPVNGNFKDNIKKLYCSYNTLAKEIVTLRKKTEKYQSKVKYLSEAIDKKNRKNQEMKESYSNIIDKLNSDVKQLNSVISSLKDEKNKVDNSIELVKADYEDKIMKMEAQHLNEISTREQQLQDQEVKYNREIEAMKVDVKNIKTANASLSEENCKLNVQMKSIILTKTNLENELSLLKTQFETSMTSTKKRFENEKNAIVESNNRAIAELKEQCAAQCKTVEILSKELSEVHSEIFKLSNSNQQLSSDKKRLESQVKAINEKLCIQKKMDSAAMLLKTHETEELFDNKLLDMKNKYESEKRRIYSVVFEKFKGFTGGSLSTIDESAFRTTLNNVVSQLNKYENSDNSIRRMLSVHDSQTTEDAVAQLLLMKHDYNITIC